MHPLPFVDSLSSLAKPRASTFFARNVPLNRPRSSSPTQAVVTRKARSKRVTNSRASGESVCSDSSFNHQVGWLGYSSPRSKRKLANRLLTHVDILIHTRIHLHTEKRTHTRMHVDTHTHTHTCKSHTRAGRGRQLHINWKWRWWGSGWLCLWGGEMQLRHYR